MRLRAVSVANNHVYDFGERGVQDTLRHLQSARIPAVGAEVAPDDPPPVAILPLEAGGSVGFYAACFDLPETAGRRPRGLEPIRSERARAAANRLTEGGASVRIALLHLGLEGQDHPEPADVQRMRAVAAAGFDVVAACHGHRLQGAEARSPEGARSFLFFGLGSLASSCIYGERERDGLVVLLGLDDAGKLGSVEVTPVRLADDGRPSVPPGEQAQAILVRFDGLSRALEDGTYRAAFYEAASRGLWRAQAAEMVRVFKRGGPRGLLVKLRQLRWKHLERAWHAAAGKLARPRKS
jgi:poly-gamma-glutamate synthesis protein (capsule biosynthesis protein)